MRSRDGHQALGGIQPRSPGRAVVRLVAHQEHERDLRGLATHHSSPSGTLARTSHLARATVKVRARNKDHRTSCGGRHVDFGTFPDLTPVNCVKL